MDYFLCINLKHNYILTTDIYGNSPAVQWLGTHAFTAESWGSILVAETKIPQVTQHSQKKKLN